MEKEINFEQEIEEVFSGNIYKKIGLKDDPFAIDPKDRVKLFVDRIESFNKLLRGIRNLKSSSQPHIAILGNHGIGKTHFIQFAYEMLQLNKNKIGIDKLYYVKGKKGFQDYFLKDDIEKSEIISYIKENPSKKVLIFFDDIDVIFKRYSEKMINIFDLCSDCIIGTWDTHAWSNLKTNTDFKIPKTEAIYIDRLDMKYCEELLKKRIDIVKINNTPNNIFPDFVINRLSVISDGNPYRLITYAKRYLDYILDNYIREIDNSKFEKFCDKINIQFIEDIKKRISKLTEKQRDILGFIIENVEISSQEIADKFDMSRIAGMKNLKILREEKVLESKTKDRTDYYYVPTDLVFDISDYLEKLKELSENVNEKS